MGTIAVACLMPGAVASAEGGDLLWQDRFAAHFLFYPQGGVAASDDMVVVAAESESDPGNIDILVRAYQGETGELVWQDRVDPEGGWDTPFSLVVGRDIAVVGGNLEAASGSAPWLIRTYDLASGALLWQDVRDNGGYADVESLAMRGGRVIAHGSDCGVADCDWITRAYDRGSGALSWEARFDGGDLLDPGYRTNDVATGLAATWAVAVAGGYARSGAGTTAFAVQAYDLDTGEALWSDYAAPPTTSLNWVTQIASSFGRAFAVGIAGDDWLVRAYHARTGALLWEHTYRLDDTLASDLDLAFQVVTDGARVFVGGYGSHAGGPPAASESRDWVVYAYDAWTGRPLWSDVLDFGGDFDELDGGLALYRGQLFAYGVVTPPGDVAADLFLRAYDARDGETLWEDRFGEPGVTEFSGFDVGLAANGGRVTLLGRQILERDDGTLGADWIVRTYDAAKRRRHVFHH